MFGMPAPGSPTQFNQDMLRNMLNNPDMVKFCIDTYMPNLTPEQKNMFMQQFEVLKQNPEFLNAATQNLNSQFGEGLPNNMMGTPNNMMGNPNNMMGTPMMNNPNNMMGTPMMNNMYNPYMNQGMPNNMMQQGNNQYTPSSDIPCSHGFYPPEIRDGKPSGMDAKKAFSTQLSHLHELGYDDEDLNLELLVKHNGDIHKVLDDLAK